MLFIIIVLGVAFGTLLACGLAYSILLNPKILKWMMKRVHKLTEQVVEEILDEEDEL